MMRLIGFLSSESTDERVGECFSVGRMQTELNISGKKVIIED